MITPTATVRDARRQDLPAAAAIYAAAAAATAATFDLEGRPLSWWEDELADGAHHFLVAATDGAVLGYARSARHKERAAYGSTCETSVYIAEAARGRGVATA